MNKTKWWIKNWPEAFVALDLWASNYPRRESRLIKALRWVIHPICRYAVSKWDDM